MSDSDLELLKLAAMAAGHAIKSTVVDECDCLIGLRLKHSKQIWNPLTEDGDALRLAMALELGVVCKCESDPYEKNRSVVTDPYRVGQLRIVELHKADPAAATRRAIVRAAAAIAKATA